MLFLLFEAAEFMCVHNVRQKLANLRIILYKECNKCDVTEQSTSWDTCGLPRSRLLTGEISLDGKILVPYEHNFPA